MSHHDCDIRKLSTTNSSITYCASLAEIPDAYAPTDTGPRETQSIDDNVNEGDN
ncbi:hypothetical protein [Haloarcula sp. CBA1127]|uniref:hypothetical protein n=1 Tax=Haloarcula sp. CBA1127 TaxID=1765055 RepID=UPI000AD952E9|nr:hypothetical protein [Haloarcula sp. CBA1127]